MWNYEYVSSCLSQSERRYRTCFSTSQIQALTCNWYFLSVYLVTPRSTHQDHKFLGNEKSLKNKSPKENKYATQGVTTNSFNAHLKHETESTLSPEEKVITTCRPVLSPYHHPVTTKPGRYSKL